MEAAPVLLEPGQWAVVQACWHTAQAAYRVGLLLGVANLVVLVALVYCNVYRK